MRKAHMKLVIDGLQRRIAVAEKERDEARDVVHEALTRLHGKASEHATAIGKLGSDISGLAEAVRAAIRPAEKAPEPPALALAAADAPAVAAEAPAAKAPAKRNGAAAKAAG